VGVKSHTPAKKEKRDQKKVNGTRVKRGKVTGGKGNASQHTPTIRFGLEKGTKKTGGRKSREKVL